MMLGRNMMPWCLGTRAWCMVVWLLIRTAEAAVEVVAMVMDEVEVLMVEVMVTKGEVTIVGMSMLS